MKTFVITIKKIEVYNEVAKTTAYTGSRKENGNETTYGRIFTSDADREMLERFWTECCDDATSEFKPFLQKVSTQVVSDSVDLGRNYEAVLEISNSFDESLVPAISSSLFSYFVNAITSKWFEVTNKEESEKYAASALGIMEGVRSKLYYRTKPRRRVPV